jgi:tripartite-type tricarboxylate transporter receptor subunit TctC
MRKALSALATLMTIALPGVLSAEDFYQGKTLRLVVGSDVGGGYDSYARTFAQHYRKHIPGEPTVVVQNMPGAGGIAATNWLYAAAPKDGLAIGLGQRGVPFQPFFGEKNAKFVPTEFNWLGSFNADTGVVTIWSAAKVKSMDDAFRETAVLGGSGPNDSEAYPALMNRTIGTKFRIVSGYRSNSAVMLAIERGEVDGVSGSWSSMKAQKPQWLRDKQVNVVVQIGKTRHPDLASVPLVIDYVKRDEDRAMWNVMIAMATMGRPLAAPPGVSPELVKILRAGFEATMKDPEFRSDMERTHRELTPVSGEEMQHMLEEVARVPADTLMKLNTYIKRE